LDILRRADKLQPGSPGRDEVLLLMLKKLSTLEATFIVLMAACGIALKPVVGPMAKLVGSALFIPSGALAGAVYMMWPMLALLVVRRFGAALLVGLLEGIILLVTGLYGSHGFLSLAIYVLPCFIIDVGFWAIKRFNNHWLLFVPTAFGNVTGTALVGIIIMHMPTIPLLASLAPAFIFGGIGGLFAGALYRLLIKSFPQFHKKEN